jgi:hypothetical protein
MQRALVSTSIVTLLLAAGACSSDTSSTDTSDASEASTDASTVPATTDTATTTPASPTSAPATTAPPSTVGDSAPSTAPTDAPVTTAAGDPDQELARSILVTLDDFPEGWEETPDDGDDDDAEQEAALDACLGEKAYVDNGVLDELEVTTGDFAPADASVPTVQHNALLAPDLDTAAAAFGEAESPLAPDCYESTVRGLFEGLLVDPESGFPEGSTLGEVTLEVLPYETDGPQVVSYFVTVPVVADGETNTFFYELFYLRSGRALSQLAFYSVNEPFPEEGVDALVSTTLDRIAALSDA